jgi:hypothetical protein
MNLDSENVSYIISASRNLEALQSYLYSRNYSLINIKEYYNGEFGDMILASSNIDNIELKNDAMNILDIFNQGSLIIKYLGDQYPKKLYQEGRERIMEVSMYNTDSSNRSYIYNGISFSFLEKKIYKFPKKVSDFKNGMVVECYSNRGWIEKKIQNIESEFVDLYSKLAKYDRVRVACD